MKLYFLFILCLFCCAFSYAQTAFQKCYGGANNDEAFVHKELSDHTVIIAGTTYSFGAGSYDAYVVKIAADGTILWSKTYGNNFAESIYDILITPDGGFLFAGSCSYQNNTSAALYLVKTDSLGTLQWSKTYYDDNLHNELRQLIPTSDGGYVGVGKDQYYIPLFKINASGDLVFSTKFDLNGTGISYGSSIVATTDGGFVLTGYVRNNLYLHDIFLLKTNAVGTIQWIKSYSAGAAGSMEANHLIQLSDGSLVLSGFSDAFGAGQSDVLLMKTDANGNLQWIRAYGGADYDAAQYLAPACTGGGFVLSGYSRSFRNGIEDLIILKTDANGILEWSKSYGGLLYENSHCISVSNSCSLLVSGTTESYGSGAKDFYFLKLNTDGTDTPLCNIKTISPTQTIPAIVQTNLGGNFTPWNTQQPSSPLVQSPATLVSDSVCRNCVPPKADFDYVQNIMTVNFLNYSQNKILSAWNFGDGNTDTASSPIHTYTSIGDYTVKLVVNNECGKDTIVKKISVVNTSYCLYNIQPGPTRGQDADLFSLTADKNMNRPYNPYINAVTWTWGGEQGTQRTLLKFDLGEICDTNNLISSNLSMFYPTATPEGGYLYAGVNNFSLYRITSNWKLNTVTWSNQPSYTTAHGVDIGITARYSNILGLDVTTLVKDMISTTNYGFMIKLASETTYRGVMYASSDWTIASQRPLLQLTFNPLHASVAFTDTIICPADSIQLTASGGIRYLWQPAQGLSCTDCANPKAHPDKDTTYTVYIYSCENCAVEKKISVKYPKPLQLDHHQVYICKGDSVKLVTSQLEHYHWSPSTGLDDDTSASPFVSPESSMKYYINGTSGGCPFRDSVLVQVSNGPSLPKDTLLCRGDILTLNLSTDGSVYLWNNGNTNPIQAIADTGLYWVQVSNQCGTIRDSLYVKNCCNKLDRYDLFDNHTLQYCFDNEMPLRIKPTRGNTFSWSNSTDTLSYLDVSEAGLYVLTAYNEHGCPMHDSVLVSDFCLPSIYIPEAFSPNGDKQNDYLEIFGRHFKNFDLKIFNRWGEIIFISNDKDLFWDGLYRGEEMPIGTYPWILHYESTYGDAGIQTKKGSVILLR